MSESVHRLPCCTVQVPSGMQLKLFFRDPAEWIACKAGDRAPLGPCPLASRSSDQASWASTEPPRLQLRHII